MVKKRFKKLQIIIVKKGISFVFLLSVHTRESNRKLRPFPEAPNKDRFALVK